MAIYEHITEFSGRPVVDWVPGLPLDAASAYRIALSWDEADDGGRWADKFASFLATPGSDQVTALIVGYWEEPGEAESIEGVIAALIAAHDQLPNLQALFLGEMVSEENEISWIEQGVVGPLLAAYPYLEHFAVRGGNSLSFGILRHNYLRSLTVESGGLPQRVLAEIGAARLPELRHLELWLGTENYGFDGMIDDLVPILAGDGYPALEYLGLRDSEIADAVAAAAATAPILSRLQTLDLSLGNLSDDGAQALLASPAISQLRKLDIHHHYCSPAIVAQLEQLGIEVDASEVQEPDEYDGETYRYVAVSE